MQYRFQTDYGAFHAPYELDLLMESSHADVAAGVLNVLYEKIEK